MSQRKLRSSLKKFSNKKEERLVTIAGELGLPLNGQKLVEVPNRKGYVFVRLHNNTSEVIQAYNSEVSTIYGLAVLVARQNNIYRVIGRDLDRYRDWSNIPYLPKHGGQHSFNPALGMGADITWVYSPQFMPLLGYPSGTDGSKSIMVAPYTLKDSNGMFKYVGNTGTQDISQYRPSSGSIMVLVYVDSVSGNPYLLVGSGTVFSSTLTGTNDITPYIPQVTNPEWIPTTAVRLTTGTNQIFWSNLYDVRPFFHPTITGSTGGGTTPPITGSFVVQDEGVALGSATTLNVVGTVADISLNGTVARLFITGSTGGGINTGTLDARYLKLDASNDPLTGTLTITPPIGNQGINITTENTGISEFISQQGVSGSAFVPATLYLQRRTMDNSAPLFNSPIIQIEKLNVSGTFQNGILDYTSNLVSRVAINTDAQGTGTLVYFDGDFQLSSNGLLLLLKNNGSSRFYVNASGTAYSNGEPLIKEAPTSVGPYGRKNSGWEIVTPANGWIPQSQTWIRTGNHTFIVSGNLTGTYQKGTKVWYTDSGVGDKYGVVGSYTFTSGTTTTLNLIPNTDYIASGTVANPYISYIENPVGFPAYFNYTPTYSASASMTYTSVSTITATWNTKGRTIFVRVLADGTTGGTASVTLFASAPITEAVNSTNMIQPGSYAEGGAGLLGFSFVSSGLIGQRKADSSNYGLGAGRTLNANVNYEF